MFKSLSELIKVLEVDIPANPRSPKHQKQVNALQRILSEYFKDLDNAFPYSKLDSIYNKNVKESIGQDAEDVIDPVIKVLKATLLTKLRGKLVEIYFSGTVETVSWGKTKGGIPITYEGPPMQAAIDWAEKHGAQLVTQMDEETKRRLANIISQGIENKRGVPGLSKDLRTAFGDMSKFRSEMISRTETANALSQSSLAAMEDMGIDGKEWIVNNPCDICLANEGDGPIPVTQAFSSGDMAPPAHPNAIFEDSKFVSYGSLHQIIRSKYRGPARSIQTDRVTFTIGPNHPILTDRGWVKASEIHEGDQLIYDMRTENLGISRVKSDFNQVPCVKDVFNSLVSMFGYATITSPRAYFHGDEVFAYGEIEVILPTVDLLQVLDAIGIEQFGKSDFMCPNPNTINTSSSSSSLNSTNRVLVAAPGIVGCLDLVEPFFLGHLLPSHFKCTTVTHVEISFYDGWAYDASTSTALYNSSGIVVKNCECAIAPFMLQK